MIEPDADSPSGAVFAWTGASDTPKLREVLAEHKPALLELLRQPKARHTLADRVVIIRMADAVMDC